MVWKPEYAKSRREKYQSDPEERARRKAQSRLPEENKKYMRQYYQENKERWVEWQEDYKEEKNRRRRERYANDPEYREKCLEASKNRSKRSRINTRLKSAFGIDIEDYEKMLEKQNGTCAICGATQADARKHRLHVDHCHDTGKVRGLLCSNCNMGLGKFQDDLQLLKNAVSYLENPTWNGK